MADNWKLCLFVVLVTTSMDSVQCNTPNCTANFKVKDQNVSADSVATLKFGVDYSSDCFASLTGVYTVVVARYNEEPPHDNLCQIVVLRNGTCSFVTFGCHCSPSPENFLFNLYSVTKSLENVSGETWQLRGSLRNGETFWKQVWIQGWIPTTIHAAGTTAATETQGVQSPVTVIALSSALAAAVVIIIIVIAVSYRLRHPPGQVNSRSAEAEMAAVYSRHDPDVHHYLGLPRPESTIYTEPSESAMYTAPRESPSPSSSLLPSNVPGDYLHPVASTQERV